MNFNANAGSRQPLGRKLKRVSDVNAMGYSPYAQPEQSFSGPSNNVPIPTPSSGDFSGPNLEPSNFESQRNAPTYGFHPNPAYNANPNQVPTQFNVFGQPVVQDMAFQYGQQLASTGKAVVQQNIEKYVPVSRLKYYFAVDTKYVLSKLGLLLFPFTHKDWSVKYEQEGPIQPRFEINAPDLYIPTMAYLTYVVVAGLILGTQQRFSPEQIGILASSALAWCIVELAVYSGTLYVANIQTSLRTLDLLAYCGYKFVGIIIIILLSLMGGKTAYYVGLVYTSLALSFYLVRTLRVQILQEVNQQMSYYGDVPTVGHKRRQYFLLFVAAFQPVLSWWLTYHLLGNNPVVN